VQGYLARVQGNLELLNLTLVFFCCYLENLDKKKRTALLCEVRFFLSKLAKCLNCDFGTVKNMSESGFTVFSDLQDKNQNYMDFL